ncbi:MAG TPA: cysteine--tRNA ligase [Candidatus Saccharimonadales bacterium]|nr:cysteine--tRNA ligase [Candidatus Saccharimonadales bacterium]
MKLYNTLTRNIDEIEPLNAPTVTVYTCGPTVYDYAHIGHWFNYVRMDTLIRVLKASGLQPEWVMNITDVGHLVSDADEGEDKLEKGARREGKTAWEVAKMYEADFLGGMRTLNLLSPDHIVRATEHIPEQIELIQKLEEKGFSYVIDDGVYFDTSKFEGYAAFARLDLDDQQAGARVAVNPQKRNQTDFALWKFSPNGKQRDMEWDSPWGKGFPGWHIECSAMSMKYLGETLDIHTGGIDHIPVHHTNEIAQSEAATGKRFSQVWMHSNHVMVNGEKISKSLGNSIRLQEILAKGISAEAVRLHVLESHYRSQSKFSLESLQAAQNRLQSYQAMADLKWQQVPKGQDITSGAIENHKNAIDQAIKNDLSTPSALSTLDSFERAITTSGVSDANAEAYQKFLEWLDDLLGLKLSERSDLTAEQKQLIAAREQARTAKDWQKSDELREQLARQGVGLRDTPHGAVWHRT